MQDSPSPVSVMLMVNLSRPINEEESMSESRLNAKKLFREPLVYLVVIVREVVGSKPCTGYWMEIFINLL